MRTEHGTIQNRDSHCPYFAYFAGTLLAAYLACVGFFAGCPVVGSILTNQPPTVEAMASTTTPSVEELVQFTMTASDPDGSVALYEWDFESDGTYDFSSTTSGTTTHAYATAGTYTATARVTDNGELTATDTFTLVVGGPATENQPPTVNAVASPTTVPVGQPVEFRMGASDPDGWIINHQWDFEGDGTYDYSSAISGTTTHPYSRRGTYTATAQVTDNGGLKATDTVMVVVQGPNEPPTVTASASPAQALIGQPVDFSMTASDPDGSITKYEWDFESDGTYDYSSSTSETTTHTYTSFGTYTATARVTDNDGAIATDTVIISVLAPEPLLSVSPTTLDFGGTTASLTLEITNFGVGTLTWSIPGLPSWATASRTSGTDNATVTITVYRSGLGYGYYTHDISITSNGGNATVTLKMTVSQVGVIVE